MAGRFSVSAVFKAVDAMTGPVRRMQRGVGRFSRSAEMSLRRVDRMAGTVSRGMGYMGAAAITAGYGFQRLVGNTTQGAEEVLKFSNRLGVGVQWMQRWQGVARRFGVQNEAMQDGLKELQMRVDEAVKTGKGPAVESLQRLGFSRAELKAAGGDAEQLFNMVRSRIQGIDDFAKRQRIVDELFGGQGGEQMVEMLGASEAKIREMFARVDEAGGIYTREELQRVREYNRGVTDLSESFRAVKRSIVIDMLPALKEATGRFRSWIRANEEAITSGVGDFLSYVANNLETILTWMKRIAIAVTVWYLLHAALKTVIAAMTVFNFVMAMSPITWIVLAITLAVAAIAALVYWLYTAVDWMGLFGKISDNAMWLVNKGIELLGEGVAWLMRQWDDFKGWWVDLWESVKGKAEGAWNWIKGQASGAVDKVKKPWNDFQDWWDELWSDIEWIVDNVMANISSFIDPIVNKMNELLADARGFAMWLGIGDDDDDDGRSSNRESVIPGGGMVSPQARTASEMSSYYEERSSTLFIRDETGRAEWDPRFKGWGNGVKLQKSGEP